MFKSLMNFIDTRRWHKSPFLEENTEQENNRKGENIGNLDELLMKVFEDYKKTDDRLYIYFKIFLKKSSKSRN